MSKEDIWKEVEIDVVMKQKLEHEKKNKKKCFQLT